MDDFNTLNKKALMDEMSSSLSNLNEFLNNAMELCEEDGKVPYSALIGMSHQIGFLTAVFNQYVIFERGFSEKQEPVGFKAVAERIREKEENK